MILIHPSGVCAGGSDPQTKVSPLTGKLFVVATPIGNLEDVTLRALRVLGEVDLIAAEDTRRTAKLLGHFKLSTPTISFHEHNERRRTPQLVAHLRDGKNLALVTDAGTPGICDPGYRLVVAALEAGIIVIPVPGPSALLAALSASGLPTDSFTFAGFLPSRPVARRRAIASLTSEPRTLVIYEAPHRVRRTLADLAASVGRRRACVARELTKIHEEWRRGTLEELAGMGLPERGEFVLVIEGQSVPPTEPVEAGAVRRAYNELVRAGAARKEAIKEVAARYGVPARTIFRLLETTNPDNSTSP